MNQKSLIIIIFLEILPKLKLADLNTYLNWIKLL